MNINTNKNTNKTMNATRYSRKTGTYTQGSVNPRIPREGLVHLDVTDERRIRLGITSVRSPLCRNGSHHLTLTQAKNRVTCPACLAKLPKR